MTRFRDVAAAAVLLCTALAHAQETASSPYYIGASQTVTHDTNLLRVTEGTPVPAGYSRSDTTSTTSLLAGFDQPFGRQRGYLNAAVRHNRYSKNDFLNNQSYSVSGGLDLSTIERISGSITANLNRGLQRFTSEEVGFLTDKNLQTSENISGRASIGVVTRYSLELNGSYQRIKNSLEIPSIKARDFSEKSGGFALQWRPSGATTIGLGASTNRGEYPRFRTAANGDYQPDKYERNTLDLTAALKLSGLSSFDARISTGKTKYELNSARDFDGVTGTAAWMYQPTGKLQFNASFSRDTGQESYATTVASQAATADYGRISNNYSFRTNYAFSAKITFNAALAYYDRKLVQSFDNAAAPNAEGGDKTTILALGARWAPLRNASLGCDVSREKRNASGQLVADLKSNTYSCFGQLTLQ